MNISNSYKDIFYEVLFSVFSNIRFKLPLATIVSYKPGRTIIEFFIFKTKANPFGGDGGKVVVGKSMYYKKSMISFVSSLTLQSSKSIIISIIC